MRHTLCTIIIISYYSSFFVSGWFYGHLNEVSDNETTALTVLHYGYTWWYAVSLVFCYKPLWWGLWGWEPQLLAWHYAQVRHVDLSIYLYFKNLATFPHRVTKPSERKITVVLSSSICQGRHLKAWKHKT